MKNKNIDWGMVDWKNSDVVLHSLLGLTRERIRQKRLEVASIVARKDEIQPLLAVPEVSLLMLNGAAISLRKAKREVLERIQVEQEVVARNGIDDSPQLRKFQEEFLALRHAYRDNLYLRHLVKNHGVTARIVALKPVDLIPTYWHRPSKTKDIVAFINSLPIEKMHHLEIVQKLHKKGYIRGFSWVSGVLKKLGRKCLRKKVVRGTKYEWGLLTKGQYRRLTDGECAKLLDVSNPSVVTQWRRLHKIMKVRPVKEKV